MSTRPVLFHAAASPFVRKVMVLLHETGQIDSVELYAAVHTPIAPDAGVLHDNPAGKIPALRLADGQTLSDSRVILEYLDQQHAGEPLIPREGAARWRRLTLASLADAVLDAAVLIRYETAMRPQEKHWDKWLDNQQLKIVRTLAYFDGPAHAELAGRFDIAAIGVGCALGYLDFRQPHWNWRAEYPQLAKWFAEVSQRPSMQATVPA
ncbi:glutathione S-transferase family protein [Pseudomonas denitrificans (nom. rej.)]|nr:glutathione S-transferase family protein [Pseudomonas denitrificans (nom. rej.)]